MPIHPSAGQPAPAAILINPARLVTAYYSERPDPKIPSQRVAFGTSGHRGSALNGAFNEWHILAITQAICEVRKQQGVFGPLFLGIDTHALSEPAFVSATECLAANKVDTMIARNREYTPTPAVSHAILNYNRGRTTGLADGIVVTPSHNPPEDGGFKYNPPHGGPADSQTTTLIQNRANELLAEELNGVKAIHFSQAIRASTVHEHDFVTEYVNDLAAVLDLDAIRESGIRMAVDPLGGAGVHYWEPIADRYKLNLTILNDQVDTTFRFMTLDWDGRIRMDPSSPYAMRRLTEVRDKFDIAFACDTDHDRHGVVTRSAGLLNPNHYLSVCVHYLYGGARGGWSREAGVGKTVVSSSMLDRVAAKLGRNLYEVPVGFKWFVDGLLNGSIAFGGEESAGASFLTLEGAAWSTDKDGVIAALLSAEITARTGKDPGEIYENLCAEHGRPFYERIDAPANAQQRSALGKLSGKDLTASDLAGEKIEAILTKAPGNGQAIGGIKVVAKGGWFAARPSGTEDVYKIYAGSFRGPDHLKQIQEEAQAMVGNVIAPAVIQQ